MTTHPETKNAPTSGQAKPTTDHASPQLGEAAAIEASGMGQAVMKDSQAALKEITAGSHEWMDWARKAYEANLKAWRGMAGCRTPSAVADVQSRWFQDHAKLISDGQHRMTTAMAKSIGARPAHSK
jgi:hypothetical protein